MAESIPAQDIILPDRILADEFKVIGSEKEY
jgi:hypothetical protein